MQNLPRILPARHLRCVTSLQLVMHNAESFYEGPLEEKHAWAIFDDVLSALETSLPSLKKLYLSFADSMRIFPFMTYDPFRLEKAVQRVDKMTRRMRRAQQRQQQENQNTVPVEIEVALYPLVYSTLVTIARERCTTTRFENVGQSCFAGQRFWRPCGKQEEEDLGYWIRTGMDEPLPHRQVCFASSANMF